MLHYDPDTVQGLFLFGVCAYKLDGAARMAYWSSEPNVGDIIVFSHDGKVLVKRVAAVAGEAAWTWKGPETVPCGMLYLLGDNIDASIDSRLWVDPFVPVENVIARYYE